MSSKTCIRLDPVFLQLRLAATSMRISNKTLGMLFRIQDDFNAKGIGVFRISN